MKAYQMKIMIKHSHPPIWRRFTVPAGLTFSQLSFILNEVMGWNGGHLSQFEFYHMGVVIEEDPDDMDWLDKELLDATETRIDPFMDSENWFNYIYDFGDYWEHRVEIEKIITDYDMDYPIVLKYKGNTPYEDCGGIYDYYHLLEVLENPENKEYSYWKDWVDELPYEEYDLEQVNKQLTQYSLSKKKHEPMSQNEIYESLCNGEPLYTITCADEPPERTEASMDEWKLLYETAQKIKELKPWEQFWDMDLFALQEEDHIAFAVILGKGGECYGISIYEDLEGLNDFMMLFHQKSLNITDTYIAMNQNNLTCYWGNRNELSKEQYEIVKTLGYKFRGKNQWLYFISNKTGYFPYNLDQAEVQRMNTYLTLLHEALEYYKKNKFSVDFESGNMFLYSHDKDSGTWHGAEEPLPFTSYIFLEPEFENNKSFARHLQEIPQADYGIVFDVGCIPSPVRNDNYERPGSVRLLLTADIDSGLMLGADMIAPHELEGNAVINCILEKIFDHGRPREIRVCNEIVAHYLRDVCKIAKIKLKKVKRISLFQKFLDGLMGF